jgi:lipid-binding SYLF domain-containing protein
MKVLAAVLSAAVLAGTVSASFAQEKTEIKDADRLDAAKDVISQIMNTPDKGIPQTVLAGASCVVVVPALVKGAFLVGAEYGKGVATCRTPRGWSAPVFVLLSGGSFGFQIGGQSTELVLVAMNKGGLQHLLSDKFKIGGDAAASAGPVGRNAQAGTDWKLNAEFLTYSRSKGLFAGIDLNGAVLAQDKDDTRAEYGSDIPFKAVLSGSVPTPENARPFVRTVARSFVVSRDTH